MNTLPALLFFTLCTILLSCTNAATPLNLYQWKNTTVMIVGAHPDDIASCAAGTAALLLQQGTRVVYVVTTNGDKGWHATRNMTSQQVAAIREQEQLAAARVLGIPSSDVHQLDFEDGGLLSTPEPVVRERLVAVIRRVRPVAVFTWSPYINFRLYQYGLQHPDHRTTGQRVLDAVYPSARDFLAFPSLAELPEWKVKDVYLFAFDTLDVFVDIASSIDAKVDSLAQHKSQYSNYTAMRASVFSQAAMVANRTAGQAKLAEGYVHVPQLP